MLLLKTPRCRLQHPGVLENDTDVDEDVLVVTESTPPVNGTLTLNPDGSFVYTPALNFNGEDSFTYQVSDGTEVSNGTVTITITPVNDPPVAEDDTANTDEGVQVDIDVAQNDTDVDDNLNTASTTNETNPTFGTLTNNGDGTFTYTPNPRFSGSDSFTYEICDTENDCDTATVQITVNAVAEDRLVYVSLSKGGAVGGVHFADEDILAYNLTANSWSKYFDGSDVGLRRADIDAFTLFEEDDGTITILLSLNTPKRIGHMWVDDSDILKFRPALLGNHTAGSFEFYLDGSDVGLTRGGEDIDAIGFTPDGRLVVSTVGSFKVSGVKGSGNDLIAFNADRFGPYTSGLWELYFDGSDVGLGHPLETVWGAWIDKGTNEIYLTARGFFQVDDVAGKGADIFICEPQSTGPNTDCNFSLFFDGSASGLHHYHTLDGIAVDVNSSAGRVEPE